MMTMRWRNSVRISGVYQSQAGLTIRICHFFPFCPFLYTYSELCGRYAANVIIACICFPTGAGESPVIWSRRSSREGTPSKAPASPYYVANRGRRGVFSSLERSPTGRPVAKPNGPLPNRVGHLPNGVILGVLGNGLAK
jgi:hypothetical protein